MARWIYKTRVGIAEIVSTSGGFTLVFDGEALEEHSSPNSAAEALANGTSFWPSYGDTSDLSIPEDVAEWTRTS